MSNPGDTAPFSNAAPILQRRRDRRARASLPGRAVSQHRLAHAPGCDDQLGGGLDRPRPVAHLQQQHRLGAAAGSGGSAGGRVPQHRGPPLPVLRLLAGAGAYPGNPVLRADPARARACRSAMAGTGCCIRTMSGPACTSPTGTRSGAACARTTAGSSCIQVASYTGKLLIHPEPIASLGQLWARAAIGPVPGGFVLAAGLLFHGGWMLIAFLTRRGGRGRGQTRSRPKRDEVLDLARQAA